MHTIEGSFCLSQRYGGGVGKVGVLPVLQKGEKDGCKLTFGSSFYIIPLSGMWGGQRSFQEAGGS